MTYNQKHNTQTKDMISDALFRLMDKKDYSRITIKELTEYARVARRTFYKHFTNKDDVINYKISMIDKAFTKRLIETAPVNAEAYGVMFFSFFKSYFTEIRALHRNNLFYTKVYYMYSDFMTEHPEIVEVYKINNSEYNIAYRFGGTFFMLTEWIDNGATVPVEEMAKYLASEIPGETS
ncbi:MAG: TetR/AcrR family transcriptional regulator [Spirochaetales bacterium]|nr:TetR/AcrR family transcriptional regulator [Spirochaetales bacterium]